MNKRGNCVRGWQCVSCVATLGAVTGTLAVVRPTCSSSHRPNRKRTRIVNTRPIRHTTRNQPRLGMVKYAANWRDAT